MIKRYLCKKENSIMQQRTYIKNDMANMPNAHDGNGTQTHKCGLDEALDDVQHGRIYEAASSEDMFKQILG